MPSEGCHCLDADGIGRDGELLTAQVLYAGISMLRSVCPKNAS
ncbi:hypothetical protein PAMC26577_02590 [Caballeronia sordidicola]|uniref:Uncharacterized protein n=1 Tax=Caballeronia sordidicola TaxID=196367 RepID=A0A242N5V4_CABSO|nr:hypothetical protein PAMC26577_02590 [Caballeronia sordidicola]